MGEGVLHLDAIKLTSKKLTSIFEKAEVLRKEIKVLKKKHRIYKVVIEKSAIRMGRGTSSAHTINLLSRFNGIVSWICYDTFGFEPVFLDPRVARKRIGLEIERGSNPKEKVVEFLRETRGFRVEYTTSGNVVPMYFDQADAYVLALAAGGHDFNTAAEKAF